MGHWDEPRAKADLSLCTEEGWAYFGLLQWESDKMSLGGGGGGKQVKSMNCTLPGFCWSAGLTPRPWPRLWNIHLRPDCLPQMLSWLSQLGRGSQG